MSQSIDKSIEELTRLNVDTSGLEDQRQIDGESMGYEARGRIEEAVNSFLIFLPHLKKQIDLAYLYGKHFKGFHTAEHGGGKLYLYADGSKSEKSIIPWRNQYHLQLYFAFEMDDKGKYIFQYYYPSVRFVIPKDDGKDKKTKISLYPDNSTEKKNMVKVPFHRLVDLVLEGYQEASDSGIQLFSQNFGWGHKSMATYKMLLPYALSAIPELTVSAAHILNKIVTNIKDATALNASNIGKLKIPDLEEAISLLAKEK